MQADKVTGPYGFIEQPQGMLVVECGNIFNQEGSVVGFLFDDGFIEGKGAPLGVWDGLKAIEELPGYVFRGVDTSGVQIVLPGTQTGPTGGMTYNNLPFTVIFGRVANKEHKVVGEFKDDGTISFRDPRNPTILRKMDEYSQLVTVFQGIHSTGEPWHYEFQRSLHRQDKAYWENEIIRYFEDIDRISGPQKKYVNETMQLFGHCGLLQLVRRNEGTAGLGNVKHGASGVTGVRTGNVTLDREEFEREVTFFKKFGALMAVPARVKPLIEVRLNMVVAHEYGHQLEFCLAHAVQDRIQDLYRSRKELCERKFPVPEEAQTYSELIQPQQVEGRIFVSGYAKASWHEYWAECVAAFAIKESRIELKKRDPDVYELLTQVVLEPEKVLSPKLHEPILNLQTSLKIGGELTENILEL